MTNGGEMPAGAIPPGPGTDPAPDPRPVPLATILREWGRIGCVGFGGPPAGLTGPGWRRRRQTFRWLIYLIAAAAAAATLGVWLVARRRLPSRLRLPAWHRPPVPNKCDDSITLCSRNREGVAARDCR